MPRFRSRVQRTSQRAESQNETRSRVQIRVRVHVHTHVHMRMYVCMHVGASGHPFPQLLAPAHPSLISQPPGRLRCSWSPSADAPRLRRANSGSLLHLPLPQRLNAAPALCSCCWMPPSNGMPRMDGSSMVRRLVPRLDASAAGSCCSWMLPSTGSLACLPPAAEAWCMHGGDERHHILMLTRRCAEAP